MNLQDGIALDCPDYSTQPHATNVLAIDPGTFTGWAVRRRDGTISYGTERFMQRRQWRPGQRWVNFRTWLNRTLEAELVHVIAYEDVRRHLGTQAAHAYGAFIALIEMAATTRNIELLPVGVGTIKKSWTGKGNADKGMMIDEAKRRGFNPDSDNAADALAVLSWACMQESSR